MTYQDALLAPLVADESLLIDFLTRHFDQKTGEVIKTAVSVDNLPVIARLENVGFQAGRQFSQGKIRMVRMSCDRYDFVRLMAETKMAEFLDLTIWSFAFDSAKRRAGLCNYTDKRISVSRYLVDIHTLDETMQVVLHEIAHAICGKSAGHGKLWLRTAKQIGYRAEKFTGREIAEETAAWIGTCPQGHTHYRYRRPARELSCGVCGRGFSKRHLIQWQPR
ncbi:SprT-like domain-containing protein [Rhodoluna sp. KAS3]|uniref:SprT-like domain-containing protein n=1 Tax=Rhodoluna sp. KAS3 TaxID=942880 RepID=UPI002230A504|nr:SprT-like domain-containing protein [Rhodoluna sp. KAS3]BDS48718.1 hypothetical protein RKAS3_02950 [Rhodoluna sp. KAS3]